MMWAVISTFVLQLMVIYLPFLQNVFETAPLTPTELAVSILIASVMLLVTEVEKLFLRARPALAE